MKNNNVKLWDLCAKAIFSNILTSTLGNCGFGPSCRFSHMSEEEMEQLRMQIEGEL